MESTRPTAYESIVISIEWYPEEYRDEARTSDDTYRQKELEYISPPRAPSGEDMGILFLNLQLFYDEMSDMMETPRHFLQVERINHPNMSISLKGLGEPIRALRDFLASIPEIIISIYTIPSRIREENAKIVTNIEYLSVARDILKAYKKAPPEYKREYLDEFSRYTLSKAKITPSLPLSIKLHGSAPSSTPPTGPRVGPASIRTPHRRG